MSLEQYKNKNRGELWDVVVIQAEVIAELEKELLLGTKNSIATDLLNVMEKDNVENFSIQVFKVDSGLKRDLQVTCEYLDGVSVPETITKLKERIAELEKERIKLLSCLLDISDECIGEITMNYKVDSEYIGGRIHASTGMTNPKLREALKEQGK